MLKLYGSIFFKQCTKNSLYFFLPLQGKSTCSMATNASRIQFNEVSVGFPKTTLAMMPLPQSSVPITFCLLNFVTWTYAVHTQDKIFEPR